VSELTLEAKVENLDEVLAFVDKILEELDCSPKAQTQVDVSVEELFVNIANYAYAPGTGSATIRVAKQNDPTGVAITFIDSGVPYNPLAKKDPDITLSAEERQIGGLGIYMAKKSMDSIEYEYTDGQNMLTITKVI
jgi:anti-sigma regulatory factor (Ser/Thr protein kinase)